MLGVGGSDLLAWIERVVGLTSNGVAFGGIAVVGVILGRVLASRTVLLLAYGAMFVLLASFLIGRRKLSVEARRSTLPSRVREGQVVGVDLGLTAKRRLATVLLEETLPALFGRTVRLPIPVLPSGQEVEHPYEFQPRLRGVYEVGPLVATWSDPLGLTRHRMVLAEAVPVIVHPTTQLVHDRVTSREWEDPPVRPPVSKPWPVGFEFYGMRDYVNGDDPRRIVWRKSAQTLDPESDTGRYLVRESEQGITDRVTLLLDTDRRAHSDGEPSDTFELAVRAAASLGVRHLDDGFSLSLMAGTVRLGAEWRGRRSQIPLLDALAKVQTDDASLPDLLDGVLATRRNSHFVVLTPSISQAAATRLRLVLGSGRSVLLVLLVTEATEPMTLHRAGMLGCPTVELSADVAMDRAFLRAMRMRSSA
jgi:uncharacterized protein (DUF58 family)